MQYSNFLGVVPLNTFPMLKNIVKREILFIFQFLCPKIPCHPGYFSHIKQPALDPLQNVSRVTTFLPSGKFSEIIFSYRYGQLTALEIARQWPSHWTKKQKKRKKKNNKKPHITLHPFFQAGGVTDQATGPSDGIPSDE